MKTVTNTLTFSANCLLSEMSKVLCKPSWKDSPTTGCWLPWLAHHLRGCWRSLSAIAFYVHDLHPIIFWSADDALTGELSEGAGCHFPVYGSHEHQSDRRVGFRGGINGRNRLATHPAYTRLHTGAGTIVGNFVYGMPRPFLALDTVSGRYARLGIFHFRSQTTGRRHSRTFSRAFICVIPTCNDRK